MRDIIVTTPKYARDQAAQEARECIETIQEGGEAWYFRNLGKYCPRGLQEGDRVYYVEDGFVRGFALAALITRDPHGMMCDTSGRRFGPGCYVCMDARTWQWIRPHPMIGFQGYRYADKTDLPDDPEVVGGWLDPKPTTT